MFISQDIHLVLKRIEGKPHFLYRLDQRHVKNNKDPTNKKYVITVLLSGQC